MTKSVSYQSIRTALWGNKKHSKNRTLVKKNVINVPSVDLLISLKTKADGDTKAF